MNENIETVVTMKSEFISDGSKVYNVELCDEDGNGIDIWCRSELAAINLVTEIREAIIRAQWHASR